jgi:DNA-binding transcriptional ArsR family regulator
VNAYESVLAALADPTRRTIFEMLREGPRSVGDLANALPVSRPAVSQHLRVLRDARLVRVESHGTRRFYRIDSRGLEPLRRYLEGFWGDVLAAFQRAAEPDKGGSHDRRDPRD